MGCLFEDPFTLLLCDASGYGNPDVRPALLEGFHTPEFAEELLLRLLPYGAGVENDEVSLLRVFNGYVTLIGQNSSNLLGIVDIHLTTEGLYEELFVHF